MKRPIATPGLSARRGRGLTRRWTLILLIALSVALFILNRASPTLIERLREVVGDGAAVVVEHLSRPVDAYHDLVGWIARQRRLGEEVRVLREENQRLKEWQKAAVLLEEENRRLSDLVRLKEIAGKPVATGRVIALTGGPFARTVLINVGGRDGVTRGMPVVEPEGVIGRVIEAGYLSARVLLATDLNSRIPVRIAGKDANGIVLGDNQSGLYLEFLSRGAQPAPGDRVLTSGHGGVFPPDMPVGMITEVMAERISVMPAVGLDALSFVQVLSPADRQASHSNGAGAADETPAPIADSPKSEP